MIENYLAYMEICMQLYVNKTGSEEFRKYHDMLDNEYKKLSQEEKEILKEIINSKINNLNGERSTIIAVEEIMTKDKKLNDVYPGHIRAQYSNKLKNYAKAQHFLQSISRIINETRGFSR